MKFNNNPKVWMIYSFKTNDGKRLEFPSPSVENAIKRAKSLIMPFRGRKLLAYTSRGYYDEVNITLEKWIDIK